ncbi:hypothetical protein HY489_02445 [Candidatus Woesearchaeota archaeon]|nr:hypothetical protein [Candidatus Woesearchaeota archaeon]
MVNKHIQDMIRCMYSTRRIGGRHTEERNITKRLKHLPREEQKEALEAWENCIRAGVILRKKSTGENHVSLNPRYLRELLALIEEDL